MPLTSRLARLVIAACLVVATWLSAAPAPSAALEPPRPLPGYRPAFVTETDVRPWRDCLWASGAMLLDKWTNGRVTRTHQQLRRLSGDDRGGSDFSDLRRAYARLGYDLKFSPDGGERITWPGLLKRLRNGAGAVLLGDYSKLPRWYGRWEHGFWKLTKKEKASKDNHAMYIERYDRKRGRVWLMDPLGRGDWKGEWIGVSALRRYAWSSRGALYVAVTPTAKAAPYAGVTLSDLKVTTTSTTLDTAWRFAAPRRWSFPGADVRATFRPAADPLAAAAVSPPVTTIPGVVVEAPRLPVAVIAGRTLRATTALPGASGAYQATITLTDRRFGRVVGQATSVAVFVPGPRRATVSVQVRKDEIEAGSKVSVLVSVGNTGTLSWADTERPAGLPRDAAWERATRLVAHWIQLDTPAGSDGQPTGPPATVQLGALPLTPGKSLELRAALVAPEALGRWALVVDVVDDIDGSFAALGSAPGVQVFEVVLPRLTTPIE